MSDKNENLAPHLMKGEIVTKSFPYRFTEEEVKELGKKAAHAYEKINTLKAQKKAIVAQHDDGIKQAELTHSVLNSKIISGIENRDFSCEVTLDFATGRKYYTNVLDGKELGSEPLDADDYQLKVKFEMKEAEKKLQEEASADGSQTDFFAADAPFIDEGPKTTQSEPELAQTPGPDFEPELKPEPKSESKPKATVRKPKKEEKEVFTEKAPQTPEPPPDDLLDIEEQVEM